MEDHGIAVSEIKLLLFPLQSVCSLLYACDKTFADGRGQQLVLFLGDLDFVVVRVFDFVLRVLVFVLYNNAINVPC